MEKKVITVSREFGSGGRIIAKELAQRLGWSYYDKELVKEVAAKTGFDPAFIEDRGEFAATRSILSYALSGQGTPGVMRGMSASDFLWCMQRDVILELAEKGNCVIVGRCADAVLSDYDNLLNVHIFAPYEDRFRNCVERLEMDEKTARRMIDKVDRSREAYHKEYGGGDAYVNCHFMVNSSVFGIEGSATLLAGIARQKFHL